MSWFQNPIISYIYFWGWRDFIEALFLITILYKTTIWLNKDRTHKLVRYLYLYCILILIANFVHLSLLFSFLMAASPAAAVLLILMHQDMLQKRFATPTKVLPAQLSTQWVDELLQASLIAMNSKKQILVIVEHQDTIQNLIATPYLLNTPCRKSVLLMLTESTLFEQQSFILISHDGIVKGINCSWTKFQDMQDNDNWKIATQICTKTDALALKANPELNTFDIVLRGNIIENLSSANCRTVLLQYINKSHLNVKNQEYLPNQKEKAHENNHT